MKHILRLLKQGGLVLLLSAGLFTGTLILGQEADNPSDCLIADEGGDGTGSRDGNPNLDDDQAEDWT